MFILSLLLLSSVGAGEIHDAAASGDLNKVRLLLEADPTQLEAKDRDGATPLHRACASKQAAVGFFLIDHGADVNARDALRIFSPLGRACMVAGQDPALVRRLIAKGADVNLQPGDRVSPLIFAVQSGDRGIVNLLLDSGAEINAMKSNGIAPLHRAAQSGDLEMARTLLDRGADANVHDNYHGPIEVGDITGTVLHVAINSGRANEALARLLVERGAKLNRRDDHENTELHLAALKGFADLTAVLVQHGGDVSAVNKSGRTALFYAARHGYRSVADFLLAAGADPKEIRETNYGKAPQLTAVLEDGEAYLWSYYFLGYAVKTRDHLLLFNPLGTDSSAEAGLANGHLNPAELAGLKITALITEPEWRQRGTEASNLAQQLPGVNFVLSHKLREAASGALDPASYRVAVPNESFSMGDGLVVHAIPASGGGMGYLVESDGVKILHAGLHVSSNEPAKLAVFRKEIDNLKSFGPVDVAVLSVHGHNNRGFGGAYEPFLYLIDELRPKVICLVGANNPPQYTRCAEVLRARDVAVFYPEGGIVRGERLHYVRDKVPRNPGIHFGR